MRNPVQEILGCYTIFFLLCFPKNWLTLFEVKWELEVLSFDLLFFLMLFTDMLMQGSRNPLSLHNFSISLNHQVIVRGVQYRDSQLIGFKRVAYCGNCLGSSNLFSGERN